MRAPALAKRKKRAAVWTSTCVRKLIRNQSVRRRNRPRRSERCHKVTFLKCRWSVATVFCTSRLEIHRRLRSVTNETLGCLPTTCGSCCGERRRWPNENAHLDRNLAVRTCTDWVTAVWMSSMTIWLFRSTNEATATSTHFKVQCHATATSSRSHRLAISSGMAR